MVEIAHGDNHEEGNPLETLPASQKCVFPEGRHNILYCKF